MRLKAPLFLCVVALMAGCAWSLGAKGPAVETVSIGSCDPTPCAKVKIETLPELPASFTDEARMNVLRTVDEVLFAPLEESDGEPTRRAFVASVRAQFDDYMRNKDPEVVVDWNIDRVASLLFSNGEVVSVAVVNRGFLGGAHGFDDERLLVFDAKTGRALKWDDLISLESRAVFLRAAEAEFKRARGLTPEKSLQEEGFTFEGDEPFGLPLNFAVTERGIVCHYNPYEVGPYVMGPTDFTVPMDVVRPALTTQAISLLGVSEAPKGLL